MLELIKELAEFERAPNEVTNTVAMMERDGFGPEPVYGFYVAENEAGIVGLALYYWRYSTWKGRRIYLEDIIVTESDRGKKIGKSLFDRMLRHTLDHDRSGMVWQVLDWNQPAIDFYKKYVSTIANDWMNCSLDIRQIESVLAKD